MHQDHPGHISSAAKGTPANMPGFPIRDFVDLRRLRRNYMRSGDRCIAVDSANNPIPGETEKDFGLKRSTNEEAWNFYRENVEAEPEAFADAAIPDWIGNVPLKTVGVLCATHIFGKNIDSRLSVLTGKRFFHNTVENVVGYVLNPILPPLRASLASPSALNGEAYLALRNIRDCFNFIFHIQVEYFQTLHKLMPDRFRSEKTGIIYNVNQFAALGPTLLNSERRYRILSAIDGSQPYDLNLNWNADFDWLDESIYDLFCIRLQLAQDAYAETLLLGEWYNSRNKNLILPLRAIMEGLSDFFDRLGLAAYFMARKGAKRRSEKNIRRIKSNLLEACVQLQRFTIDMMRMNMFSIVKHDVESLGQNLLDAVIRVRAGEDSCIGRFDFAQSCNSYREILEGLYHAIGFISEGK